MNQDQIAGVARIVVPAVCAWLAAKGFSLVGDVNVQAQIVAVIIGLASIVWSFFANSNASKLKSVARIDPHVGVEVPERVSQSDSGIKAVVADNANYPNVTEKR